MGDWFVEDLLPGETIRRRYNRQYPRIIAHLRSEQGSVDFGVCNELKSILVDKMFLFTGWQREMLHDAFAHISDAMNEDLPLHVRETHFDIAGSLVYNAFNGYGMSGELFEWVTIWSEAGGF